jgi:hypothetical protein
VVRHATVGQLAVEPGAGNVIPSHVLLSVDARAPDRERLDRLAADLGLEPTFRLEPVAMAEARSSGSRHDRIRRRSATGL